MANAILTTRREVRGMTPSHVAAFVGVTTPAYWDIESGSADDLLMELTLVQLVRLCVIFETPPALLLPSGGPAGGRQAIECALDQHGHVQIAGLLRGACEDLSSVADAIGWDARGLRQWLADGEHLGEIPLAALHDLASHLGVSLASIVDCYLSGLGSADGRSGWSGEAPGPGA